MAARSSLAAVGLSISPSANDLLHQLAESLGLNASTALDLVIREQARLRGLTDQIDLRDVLKHQNRTLPTADDMASVAAEVKALGWKGTLAEGADSRESIYGDRA